MANSFYNQEKILFLPITMKKLIMKKFFALFFVSLCVLSCGQNKKAYISGTFAGITDDTVYLQLVTTQGVSMVDSSQISKKGEFKFTVKMPAPIPTFYNIIYKQNIIPLLVAPKDHININSVCDIALNYEVEGSEDSKKLKQFYSSFYSGAEKLDSLSYAYNSLPSAKNYDPQRNQLLQDYAQEFIRLKREQIEFIVKNASSMASLYALYHKFPSGQPLFNIANDITYYKMIYDSLSPKYAESRHIAVLEDDINAYYRVQELSEQLDAQADNMLGYPDIEMQDMYGKTHKLSSLNGKVILLDFWISSLDASKASNAELKEIYSEFAKKGFEIYQVSLDTEKAEWITSVQNQKLPWISVCDFDGTQSIAVLHYNIQKIPANIIIDKNGNVVGRDIFGSKLRAKIAELTSK